MGDNENAIITQTEEEKKLIFIINMLRAFGVFMIILSAATITDIGKIASGIFGDMHIICGAVFGLFGVMEILVAPLPFIKTLREKQRGKDLN